MLPLHRRVKRIEQIFATRTTPVAELLKTIDLMFVAVRDVWGDPGVARIEEQTNSFLLPLRAGNLQEATRQALALKAARAAR